MIDNRSGPKPYVIAICQEKGGVGKTTTCAAMGSEMVSRGEKCLMIDLAPSGNLTSSFGFNLNKLAHTSADLFHDTAPLSSLIHPTSLQDLDLIPANAALSPIPRELYQNQSYEGTLRRILEAKDFSKYDYLILDCPPGMDSVSVNAIASADLVLLPMVCEYFALQTLENMFRLIRLTRERVNPGLMYRLVVTRMDRGASLHEQVYARIKEQYDDALLESIIEVDIKLPESQLAGVPIHLYDSETRGVKQYRALTQEVVNLIKKDRPSQENHETN